MIHCPDLPFRTEISSPQLLGVFGSWSLSAESLSRKCSQSLTQEHTLPGASPHPKTDECRIQTSTQLTSRWNKTGHAQLPIGCSPALLQPSSAPPSALSYFLPSPLVLILKTLPNKLPTDLKAYVSGDTNQETFVTNLLQFMTRDS